MQEKILYLIMRIGIFTVLITIFAFLVTKIPIGIAMYIVMIPWVVILLRLSDKIIFKLFGVEYE